MFNNLTNSLHDAVAQAKEEREQLDRLLTISMPRERMLVAVAASVLLVFAAWLYLGEVARSVTVNGVLIDSGAGATEDALILRTLVQVEVDAARRIGAGMAASVEIVSGAGARHRLDGEVAAFTQASDSGWPGLSGAIAPTSLHLVEISLVQEFDFAALDVAECRIVIELGRQSPISLAGLGSS